MNTPAPIQIRPAQPNDISQMVQVHLQAFPGFFLTLMGPRFLSLLYSGFLNHPSGISLVACPQNNAAEVLGFVAGTTQPQGFFLQLLKQRWLAFGLASLWPLLRKPNLVFIKLWSALFYRGESLPDLPNAALLSSLGVQPAAQGQQIGQQLVNAFLAHAQTAGAPAVYLTTDQSNNTKANQFYTRLGFRLAGTCKRPHGRILNRYSIKLNA
ncbi:GNAT family N-acetyltransferase [Limnobacter sp.]|jgi:ribosomal protein S18 acetylase RimI-like enzyme|uniref:GNAT family N-acetyltransferase n=1 Tax=Limnobacter sp. TaxID=2003368 RepID=UPI00374A2FD1